MNCKRFITIEDTLEALTPITPIYFLCFETKKVNKENFLRPLLFEVMT